MCSECSNILLHYCIIFKERESWKGHMFRKEHNKWHVMKVQSTFGKDIS